MAEEDEEDDELEEEQSESEDEEPDPTDEEEETEDPALEVFMAGYQKGVTDHEVSLDETKCTDSSQCFMAGRKSAKDRFK